MNSETTEIQYTRRGTAGTLRLQGVIDIFEAVQLRETAQKALADTKAKTVYVSLEKTERLDLTAAQILIALKRETTAAEREFQLESLPDALMPTLALLDMTETQN